MIIAKVLLLTGFAWGLSERSFVLARSRSLLDAGLLLIAIDVLGLMLLSWA